MSDCIDHGQSKCLNKGGYYRSWCRRTRRLELLHRVVYVDFHNLDMSDIQGVVIRHTCDNPRCINPEHLIKGTQIDNMRDRLERGRNPDVRGASNPNSNLTLEDVLFIRKVYIPNKKGLRSELAAKFGVSPATISDVVSNRSWTNA